MTKMRQIIWDELQNHLPYSAFATAAGIILAGIMLYVAVVVTSVADRGPASEAPASKHEELTEFKPAESAGGEDHAHDAEDAHEHHGHSHADAARGSAVMQEASHVTFHVFHPVHMLFSAIATTAMFWRYERKLLVAILTGLIGSLGVCSISDVFMPYVSGIILGTKDMGFHWCLVEHPMLVLPFAIAGVGVGLIAAKTVERSTYFSHSAHVFVSSAASIFYLVSYGVTDWAQKLGYVFILMVLAVTIPCCVSDIVFPLIVACRDPKTCACPHHHEHDGKAEG